MTGIKSKIAAVGLLALMAPTLKAQGVAFLPIPGQFNDGAFLNVTPVVSADRRYVRMGLTPQFNALNGFAVVSVPAAVGGGGNGGGLGGLGGLGGVGGGGGLGGLGGVGGGGGGGFRNQGIGARNVQATGELAGYRTGGYGAFAGLTPAGMTGGLDPLAEAVRQQMMAGNPRPAATTAPSRSSTRRRAR